jgi:hypothetical protein
VLNALIVNAAPTGEASFARFTMTATRTMATAVQMKVNVRSLIFWYVPAFKSCHLIVFGSSASRHKKCSFYEF